MHCKIGRVNGAYLALKLINNYVISVLDANVSLANIDDS
jgi:hypothetical protein